MSEATETAKAHHHTGEEAINLLATHADQIGQVAINLDKAREYLSEGAKQELFNYEVTQRHGSHGIMQHGKQYIQSHDSQYDAYKKATAYADRDINNLGAALEQVGTLAHIAHLDHHHLEHKQQIVLQDLPANLAQAKEIFERAIQDNPVTPENKEDIIQFKRAVKYIDQLSEQLGNAGEAIIAHNNGLVDRQSDLVTEQEIAHNHEEKFKKGVALLDVSEAQAKERDPSFRARISRRKSLDVLSEEKDSGPAR